MSGWRSSRVGISFPRHEVLHRVFSYVHGLFWKIERPKLGGLEIVQEDDQMLWNVGLFYSGEHYDKHVHILQVVGKYVVKIQYFWQRWKRLKISIFPTFLFLKDKFHWFLLVQAVVLSQFLSPEVDYSVAFGMAIEKTTNDASDSLYGFIWDLTILEFLINLHTKRNEMAKRQQAVRIHPTTYFLNYN